MSLILHMSDPHFGTEVPDVVAAAAHAVAALRPDILVVSGDLTQRARRRQFQGTRNFTDSLKIPVFLAVPGNHDIPLYDVFTRFTAPYRLYKKFFGARQGFWHNGALGILYLDTTDPLRHTRGKTRIDQARALLAAARRDIGKDARLIAVTHQPLAVKLPQDQPDALMNAQETAALFAEHRVDVALSGHVHMPLIRTTEGLFDNAARPFVLSGAGTAVSRRIRSGAANSFNTIRVADGEIEITLHAYNAARKMFLPETRAVFYLAATGWQEAVIP